MEMKTKVERSECKCGYIAGSVHSFRQHVFASHRKSRNTPHTAIDLMQEWAKSQNLLDAFDPVKVAEVRASQQQIITDRNTRLQDAHLAKIIRDTQAK